MQGGHERLRRHGGRSGVFEGSCHGYEDLELEAEGGEGKAAGSGGR